MHFQVRWTDCLSCGTNENNFLWNSNRAIVIEKFPEDEEIIAIWIDASFLSFLRIFLTLELIFVNEWVNEVMKLLFLTIKIN
jgi:hypothetical protein